MLTENGVPVLYDDRTEASIGAKIKDRKITGTPYVAVFGRTLEQGFICRSYTDAHHRSDIVHCRL